MHIVYFNLVILILITVIYNFNRHTLFHKNTDKANLIKILYFNLLTKPLPSLFREKTSPILLCATGSYWWQSHLFSPLAGSQFSAIRWKKKKRCKSFKKINNGLINKYPLHSLGFSFLLFLQENRKLLSKFYKELLRIIWLDQ